VLSCFEKKIAGEKQKTGGRNMRKRIIYQKMCMPCA